MYIKCVQNVCKMFYKIMCNEYKDFSKCVEKVCLKCTQNTNKICIKCLNERLET